MKTAEEWAIQMIEESDNQGGWDSEQDGIPIIEQIQLDARQQGLQDAADYLLEHNFTFLAGNILSITVKT